MSSKPINHARHDTLIESKTRLAQGQLFSRFVLTLLLCFLLIQLIVSALLIYQQHFQAKQMMSSLKVEYQRFLVFESPEKLEHVLTSYPDKLYASAMTVMSIDGDHVRLVAGLPFFESLSPYNGKDILTSNWLDFLVGPDYLSIKLNPDEEAKQQSAQTPSSQPDQLAYWLVLHVPTKLSALVEKWVLVAGVLGFLSILISFIVWRLLKTTLQPLHLLARGLDQRQAWQLDDKTDVPEPQKGVNKGLAALNQGVNQAMGQLKAANASVSHTLDAIAHDLKTPLSRILLTSEKSLASNEGDQVNREDLVNALADCAESASQADQLLTTLMKINDEVIGRHEIAQERVAIKALVTNVVSWFEEIAEDKGVQLRVPTQQDQTCITDPKRLTQILVNLIDNSIKYSAQGDSVELVWGEDAGQTFIRVKDTGMGIAADQHEAIFERLYRVDHSRTQAGYGLGLAMVKVMLASLNAKIKVTSELGKGSEFCVLLPQS